ncbi:imidazole glycerol phosphate synthase subunit HisH [Synechococcus sp. CC9311]|uniref:imidazole glycerol phosphate synthase subunit HisH n=1 Tax=Synechococcus sp. (strain CC9311) TaxID=64471 RepID=UPI0000DDA9BE|nr:imidazole glycerol phosphate synthase subunit HisH [Synechococcus sp. CC9311]ABI47087.1 imidazole glycerol phosphate synthase, glutamine amidotransferase subunit [Synechococcus sp. CC9311]|mmetsp:Transcript_62448/g.148010  ORF Transcript_62448/g.148010 Transcript_62448/m.148010 type:complete len:212 (-) Transcript_62448:365-1000(-)
MKPSTCVVIDYGLGNIFSVLNALKAQGVDACLTSDRHLIQSADRVILPGVGAFGRAAQRLRELHLDEALKCFTGTGRPFLGICVGMQLLMTTSREFGEHDGLNLIPGVVARISEHMNADNSMRIPIIGWHKVTGHKANLNSLAQNLDGSAYYFVHSYACQPLDTSVVTSTVSHSETVVVSSIQHENIMGVQFHPERSSFAGQSLLSKFLSL